MRQAPAVGVTLSGGGAWRFGQVLLAALAAAVVAAWAALHLGAAPWLAGIAAPVAAGLAWWRTQPRPVLLRWDGTAWTADAAAGHIDVMLDLQRWLLLRFRPLQGGTLWLSAPAAEAGAAWHGLRAALYSRAAFPTPSARTPGRPTD